jgi:TMEM175 potassium channel family protein
MADTHTNARLEAFCDGVFAIAMTLLIIDVKIPSSERIADTSELWRALQRVTPSVFAFVLSFGIILITWVNHHAMLRLVNKSSASFIYANGFLLLTVVFIPFPTALLGAFLLTDHAAPAVVLYDAVLAVQAIGWILLSGAALKNRLTRDEPSTATMREGNRNGYFAFAFYGLLSVAALWFPIAIATVTTASWVFWLILGVRMKHA